MRVEKTYQCRAQAELDGIQEEQIHVGAMEVGMSQLQEAELDRRKEKVAKLVKVGFACQSACGTVWSVVFDKPLRSTYKKA